MAENETPAAPETGTNSSAAAARQPTVRILAQYVKDLSFENPGNAGVKAQPNIDLGIDVGAAPHPDGNGIYEVSIRFSAEAKAGESVLFILELDYAGLFQFDIQDQAIAEQVLFIECPRMLFPFARRIIADLSRDGGFPPLMVDPVDFVALYQQQKSRQAAAQQAAPAPAPAEGPQG